MPLAKHADTGAVFCSQSHQTHEVIISASEALWPDFQTICAAAELLTGQCKVPFFSGFLGIPGTR
eukprot:1766591-Rhodomonas_salina.1